MHYSIVLSFDPDSERRVLQLWSRLEAAGFTTQAGRFQPHISLTGVEAGEPDSTARIIADAARVTDGFELRLSAIGIFAAGEGGTGSVVFLAPTASAGLTRLHQIVFEQLEDSGIDNSDLYAPGRWVPHCTAATGVDDLKLEEVIGICNASYAFGPVRIEQIALMDLQVFEKPKLIGTHALRGSA